MRSRGVVRASGPAKVAEFPAEIGNIAVGGAGEHAGRRGVVRACPYPPVQVVHLGFQCCDEGFEIPGFHVGEPAAGSGGGHLDRPPACG